MARGDTGTFAEMAQEFLADARLGSAQWEEAWRSGDHSLVGLEIHRCKGGASLFGFERLHAMLGGWERRLAQGLLPVDPGLITAELDKADAALAELLARP